MSFTPPARDTGTTKPGLDWWNACQRDTFNHEEWQQQLSKEAASLSASSLGEERRKDSAHGRPFFRPFETWQREADGDVDMSSSTYETVTSLRELDPTKQLSIPGARFVERFSSEEESTLQDIAGENSEEFSPSSSHLYHQTLTKRALSRTNPSRKIESLTGRMDDDGIAPGQKAKKQNGGGQQRRERKRMYRVTGAFHKMKNMISGEAVDTTNLQSANYFRCYEAVEYLMDTVPVTYMETWEEGTIIAQVAIFLLRSNSFSSHAGLVGHICMSRCFWYLPHTVH
jgi:hypothetical protein